MAKTRSDIVALVTLFDDDSSISSSAVSFNCGGANVDDITSKVILLFVEFDLSSSVEEDADVWFVSINVSSIDRLLFNVTGVIQLFVMLSIVTLISSACGGE